MTTIQLAAILVQSAALIYCTVVCVRAQRAMADMSQVIETQAETIRAQRAIIELQTRRGREVNL